MKHLNETLLKIFWNNIPNKKIKRDFCQLPWINGSIKSSLKQRSKLTKFYYGNALRKSDLVGHTIMLSYEMPPKTFFAYSALIMGTLKGSTGWFFNFSAQSQNFTGGSNGPDLT